MKEHNITHITDLLELEPDEFERMLPDLRAWYGLGLAVARDGLQIEAFIWVDDGLPGAIHSATLRADGYEDMVIKGEAYPKGEA